MGYGYTRTAGGLVVAQESRSEATVRAELQAFDPHLCLVQQPTSRGIAYQVWYRESDQRANSILTWADPDGTPRELNSGLIEAVKSLRKDGRGPHLDADSLNNEMKERKANEQREREEEEIRDAERRGKRSPAFHRGPHLRRDREMG